jgi:hypothetical protein
LAREQIGLCLQRERDIDEIAPVPPQSQTLVVNLATILDDSVRVGFQVLLRRMTKPRRGLSRGDASKMPEGGTSVSEAVRREWPIASVLHAFEITVRNAASI